jgi:hypothetical protein
MNNEVIIDAMKWHGICYNLGWETDRQERFQQQFKCKIKWKTRSGEWASEMDVPGLTKPTIMIEFDNPSDVSLFVLRHM